MSTHRGRIIVLIVALLIGLSWAVPATAAPPEGALQHALDAVELGKTKARGLSVDAPGQDNRARGLDPERLRGLERAAEVIAAAAERKAARDAAKEAGDKPGVGLGRGHADRVHAYLLDEGSPSDLAPGQNKVVEGLAQAFNKVKENHPGLALGHAKNGKSPTAGD